MPTSEEITEQLDLAREQEAKGGSQWPDMTYEQGVAEALAWVQELTPTKPMEE